MGHGESRGNKGPEGACTSGAWVQGSEVSVLYLHEADFAEGRSRTVLCMHATLVGLLCTVIKTIYLHAWRISQLRVCVHACVRIIHS